VPVSSWAGRQLDGFGLALPPPAPPIPKTRTDQSGIGERTSKRAVGGRLLNAQSVHGYPRHSTRYPLALLTQAGPACPDLGRVDR